MTPAHQSHSCVREITDLLVNISRNAKLYCNPIVGSQMHCGERNSEVGHVLRGLKL